MLLAQHRSWTLREADFGSFGHQVLIKSPFWVKAWGWCLKYYTERSCQPRALQKKFLEYRQETWVAKSKSASVD